jgi:hypothetical protein
MRSQVIAGVVFIVLTPMARLVKESVSIVWEKLKTEAGQPLYYLRLFQNFSFWNSFLGFTLFTII